MEAGNADMFIRWLRRVAATVAGVSLIVAAFIVFHRHQWLVGGALMGMKILIFMSLGGLNSDRAECRTD